MKDISITKCNLKTKLRELWEDHVDWTRNAIFCLVDGLPGVEQVSNRLDQNQVDIGNVIKPFYGDEAGNKLTELLKEHILIASYVINAAKAGNSNAYNIAIRKWYHNSDEIATFLANANPNLNLFETKKMMKYHLKLTTDEVMARVKKDYEADVVAIDKVHDGIRYMSDMLYKAIIKQFPEKFV